MFTPKLRMASRFFYWHLPAAPNSSAKPNKTAVFNGSFPDIGRWLRFHRLNSMSHCWPSHTSVAHLLNRGSASFNSFGSSSESVSYTFTSITSPDKIMVFTFHSFHERSSCINTTPQWCYICPYRVIVHEREIVEASKATAYGIISRDRLIQGSNP